MQKGTLGQRIARRRAQLRHSQSQLARKIGVHRVTVTNWESGKASPRNEHLRRLSCVLKVDPAWLTEGKEILLIDSLDVVEWRADLIYSQENIQKVLGIFEALVSELPKVKEEKYPYLEVMRVDEERIIRRVEQLRGKIQQIQRRFSGLLEVLTLQPAQSPAQLLEDKGAGRRILQ